MPEEGRALKEVRDGMVAAIRSERTDREFVEPRGELAEIGFDESDSLEPATEATGLE